MLTAWFYVLLSSLCRDSATFGLALWRNRYRSAPLQTMPLSRGWRQKNSSCRVTSNTTGPHATNHVEAWHSGNKRGPSHPNLFAFIYAKTIKCCRNLGHAAKKKNYRALDYALQTAQSQLLSDQTTNKQYHDTVRLCWLVNVNGRI